MAPLGLARWVGAVLVRFSAFYPFSVFFFSFLFAVGYVARRDVITCISLSVISLSRCFYPHLD